MRLAVAVFLLPFLSAAAEIPKGTHVLLRLVNAVSTRTAREGDYVYMTTAVPITAEGRVVVPQGSYVQGVVSHARRSGRVSGRAELAIRIENLTLPGGTVIRIAPQLDSVDSGETEQKVAGKEGEIRQGGTRGADAKQVATITGSGADIGGIADRSWKGAGIGAGAGGAVGLASVLLTRGREVDLRRGSTIDVVFDRAVPVP
jgi:hypothetical protein